MKYICDKGLPFHECELAILRNAVDRAEDIKGFELVNSPEIKNMIAVVEQFIKGNKLICYGGTAINNILPESDQFYDLTKEIPDYDFFSPNALQHAKDLADKYAQLGYDEVEAKAGQHFGTYKVFVNFIPIADITQINPTLYKVLRKESISISGIMYLPPNMLRMSMYLELSRPAGDISRWEKVLKRLTLLNNNYPLNTKDCNYHFFSRRMESSDKSDYVFRITRDCFIDNNVVFFGGWASHVFSSYMSKESYKKIHNYPDFDVLSTNAKETADLVAQTLKSNGLKNVSVTLHKNLDEIIPTHYEIKINKDSIAFIYQTIACYSYNVINIGDKKAKIATIDTMLSLYLAFIYAKRNYYDEKRILCMANFLFKIQQKNRLSQKGPLRRFTVQCYGEQPTRESMKAEKSEKFEELRDKRDTKEYDEWFLNYKPVAQQNNDKIQVTKLKKKTKKNKKVVNRSIKHNIKKLLRPILKE